MSVKAELKFQQEQMAFVTEKGIILPGEQVRAVTTLWSHSQLIFFFGLLARFLMKRYLVIVTDQRVIFVRVPAFLVHSTSAYYDHVAAARPVILRLEEPAAEQHQVGNPVALPQPFAGFTGRPKLRSVCGLMAQQAFDLAAEPCARKESLSRSAAEAVVS